MFRSLRLKLTLINVAVIGMILLIFSAVAYGITAEKSERLSREILEMAAIDAGNDTGQFLEYHNQFFDTRSHRIDYFFVRVDERGRITGASPGTEAGSEFLQSLVSKTLSLNRDEGTFSLPGGRKYRFYKTPLAGGSGSALVFLDAGVERRLLGHLVPSLAAAGAGVLAFVFLGSFLMAGRALVPVKEAWERQKNFVADASHELRTPLAVMQTNLELVMDNNEDTVESQMEWLKNVHSENKYMSRLVENLLFLARSDSHRGVPQMTDFILNNAVREALAPFEPVAAGKGIKLDLDEEAQVSVFGSQVRITQLVVNLLENAVKFTSPGGRIALSVRDRGKYAEVTVSDTGIGMAKDHLDKIFNRFYRVDRARSRQGGGFGLGLAIADCIVREHRGTITVTSSPGEGSAFRVTLPRQDRRGKM